MNVPSGQSKEDLKVARMLNVFTKARPSQNIRDLYRCKCGYGPCVIVQKDAVLQDSNSEYQPHFPTFEQLMPDLEIQRGETSASLVGRVKSNEYLFVPGDIVAVNPGTDNGIPTGISHIRQAETHLAVMCLDFGLMSWPLRRIQFQEDNLCYSHHLQSI